MIRKVIVYETSGTKIASYPINNMPHETTPFFTAIRYFSLCNDFGEVEMIIWNKFKCLYQQNGLGYSFAMFIERTDNDEIYLDVLEDIRDIFMKTLHDEKIEIDSMIYYDDLLEKVVKKALEKKEVMFITEELQVHE